jgi:hypothetical protein
MKTFASRFVEGWTIILRALWTLIWLLFESFEILWEIASGRKQKGSPVDCFNNPDIRARPDPYIYSQFWLFIRGIGFTWDNPDFAIIDPDTNASVDNHHLAPHKKYFVRVTIHNSSIMAAVNTAVTMEVLRFGAGTIAIDTLPAATVDVPALGSKVAEFEWTTPETAGHNCLRATILHPDDANPLNNIGQHNTDVASPASPTRKLKFHVGNHSQHARRFTLSMNSYRLPAQPLRPDPPRGASAKQLRVVETSRMSPAYLRRLREVNDFAKFPVPPSLQAKLERPELQLDPGQDVETFVEMRPAAAGQGRQIVNVNVMLDGILIGGVTAYVEEA